MRLPEGGLVKDKRCLDVLNDGGKGKGDRKAEHEEKSRMGGHGMDSV